MKNRFKTLLIICVIIIVSAVYTLLSIIQDYKAIKLQCEIFPCYEAKTFLHDNSYLIFGFSSMIMVALLLIILLIDLIKQEE